MSQAKIRCLIWFPTSPVNSIPASHNASHHMTDARAQRCTVWRPVGCGDHVGDLDHTGSHHVSERTQSGNRHTAIVDGLRQRRRERSPRLCSPAARSQEAVSSLPWLAHTHTDTYAHLDVHSHEYAHKHALSRISARRLVTQRHSARRSSSSTLDQDKAVNSRPSRLPTAVSRDRRAHAPNPSTRSLGRAAHQRALTSRRILTSALRLVTDSVFLMAVQSSSTSLSESM